MHGLPNSQRALWTFLLYTLAGPYIGALAIALLMPIGIGTGMLPQMDVPDAADMAPLVGRTAVAAFVWGALPADLTALGLLPLVLRNGSFGWIPAAVAGVLAFAVAIVLVGSPAPELTGHMSFLAGLVSLACRWVLMKAGVLKE